MIDSIEIDYLSKDITQGVSSGHLIIRGKLRPMTLRITQIVDDYRKKLWTINFCDTQTKYSEVALDSLHDNFDREHAEQSMFYMPAMSRDASLFDYDKLFVMYLWLLKVENREEGVYSRLGIATHTLSGDNIAHLESLNYQDGEENYPCQKYKDGLHTICFI